MKRLHCLLGIKTRIRSFGGGKGFYGVALTKMVFWLRRYLRLSPRRRAYLGRPRLDHSMQTVIEALLPLTHDRQPAIRNQAQRLIAAARRLSD
jgi:hypothetical protein